MRKFCFVIVNIFIIILVVNAFNISPKPNLIIDEPALIRPYPKVQSSYFGFTINLRPKGLFVGAPRAQSNLESQRNVNETGLIYKCSLQSGFCNPYIFDKHGNRYFEMSEFTWDNEKKDNQWLGAAMDGGSKDTDRLIVCAPRYKADATQEYLMHGICYWTPDTLAEQPTTVNVISPLRLKNSQVLETSRSRSFYYMFGESGLSVHWTGINEETIIGAPGIHTWKGSVIRYRMKEEEDIGGLQKRDTSATRISRQKQLSYVSEIPNPENWGQPNDSYFGYSVSSGIFEGNQSSRLLYVASAPQANSQVGEVYIFNIVKTKHNSQAFTIEKHQTFHGKQFGEFFGGAVLSEDVTGDGWTDLIVSAPLHSNGMSYEMGAVYIFINQGNFNFEMQLIVSPSEEPGRFGTTITKLGDINHDGYNDIAIGAPFDGNGKVYIYLGSQHGLQKKPSQILKAPLIENFHGRHMFGHGLSRGVDIDYNEYNDLAIGAPNGERVYLYKTYPVIKVLASISSTSREINRDQTKFQIRVCFRIETTSERSSEQDIRIKIKVDPQVKRVSLNDGSNEMDFTVKAVLANKCQFYDANVKFNLRDIFKPIELEMSYSLINKIPDSEEFCDICAALDPSIPTTSVQKIIFSTGCKSEICVADLKLTSSDISPTFVIGSKKTLSVKYDIVNNGETAYLPQLNVTSTIGMPFAKIPSSCRRNEHVLLCDLYHGQPMHNGDKDSLTITFDASNVDGNSMKIIAEVFSTGNESNSIDNLVSNTIKLTEFSTVEVISTSSNTIISLEEKSGLFEFINEYEIKNHGPSNIKEADISISIPISYLVPKSINRIALLNPNNISVVANYAAYQLKTTYFQNNSILIRSVEESSPMVSIVEDLHALNYDQSKVGYGFELENPTNSEDSFSSDSVMSRRRRAIETKATEAEYSRISQKKIAKSVSDDLMGTLPINRTISFNCNDPDDTLCIQAVLRVNNFRANTDNGVNIIVKFVVDLDEINKILIDDKEFFVISTEFNVTKINDEKGDSIDLQRRVPYNVISKHLLSTVPIWVYIVSILAGILLLVLIVYGFYKLGFFKRAKREEMATLTKNGQAQGDETEDDDD